MTSKARCLLMVLAALTLTSPSFSVAQLPEPDGGAIERGVLPDRWVSAGPRCMEVPEWQVHEYYSNLYILRQSGCTDFEKPFVFLLFGNDEALLLDTGSRNGNLAPTLQRTVHNWLKMNSRQAIPLVVVHTHGHEDHIAGDAAIKELHDPVMPLTFVPAEVQADSGFFRMKRWPEDTGAVDLGERIIDVIAIPGHSDTSIALYDRKTAILFAGDSLYPGRLYVHDLAKFSGQYRAPDPLHRRQAGSSYSGKSHRTNADALPRLSGGHDLPAGGARIAVVPRIAARAGGSVGALAWSAGARGASRLHHLAIAQQCFGARGKRKGISGNAEKAAESHVGPDPPLTCRNS